jgi:branched-subunit amino acid aminotransferase/4-amino-4-deoxychorismate lyase
MRQFYKDLTGDFLEVTNLPINRAFLFGDGIFETMVYANGQIRFCEDHQLRVTRGLNNLRFKTHPELSDVTQFLSDTFKTTEQLRVRWNIFRTGIGKYSPEDNTHLEHLMVTELKPAPLTKGKAYISNTIKVNDSAWSGTKTLNALTYIMANIERQELNMDDVILKDANGNISEAGSSNIFWVKDKVYYTPSLATNCIDGIARKQIINQLKTINIPCRSGVFPAEDFLNADQVLTTNVTGVSYLGQIDGKAFDTTPDTRLMSLFTF